MHPNTTASINFAGTTVTTGCGYIIGYGSLDLFGSNIDAVLVLGPDNALHGNLNIKPILVNRGVVDPTDPEDANDAYAIRLFCQTKLGPGDWRVTGGGTGTSTLIIDTPVVGTGNLLLGSNSVLVVNAHMSLYGTLTAGPDSAIHVAQDIMFDVDRFPLTDCPQ